MFKALFTALMIMAFTTVALADGNKDGEVKGVCAWKQQQLDAAKIATSGGVKKYINLGTTKPAKTTTTWDGQQ